MTREDMRRDVLSALDDYSPSDVLALIAQHLKVRMDATPNEDDEAGRNLTATYDAVKRAEQVAIWNGE